ncbi:Kiwa anti-phage protein KwaB-like domain-containing protein [Salinicoccus sp. CNSTN-B1]
MYSEIEEVIENGDLKIYFLKKRTIQDYKLYEPTMHDKILDWCKEEHLKFLNNNELEEAEYNPIAKLDGVVEIEKTSELNGLDKIIEKFTKPDVTHNLDVSSIKFLVFRYMNGEDEVIIFRRHPSANRILNGLFTLPEQGVYKKVDSKNYIAFDEIIDLMIHDNKSYIFSHSIVESIFFTKEEFRKRTESVLDELNSANKIENFEQLKQDILSDAGLYKRIAKLHDNSSRAKLFLSEQKNTLKTIEEFELNIEIKKVTTEDSNENLIFVYDSSSKENRRIFTNLILDAYFRTVIGNRKGKTIGFNTERGCLNC